MATDPEVVALLREFLNEHREIRELIEKALDRWDYRAAQEAKQPPPALPSKSSHASNGSGLVVRLLGHDVSKGIAHGLIALALMAVGWVVRHFHGP